MPRDSREKYPGLTKWSAWLGSMAFCASCWAAIPGREIKPLPLDRFCNKALVKSWAVIPQGRQKLDGVPFQIDGYIELASSRATPQHRVFPLEAAGIEIGKKFSRLHLLHCAEYYETSGEPLADLVLYFANGERRVATLIYGVHAQDWYDIAGDVHGLVHDLDSRVAWKGPSDDAAQFGKIVRLYHTALDNPLPDQVVTRLDIISELSEAFPMIFGISLEQEEDVTPPDDSLFKREVPSQFDFCKLRIVQAQTQQPVPAARLKITAKDGANGIWIADLLTDAQGKAELLTPRDRFGSYAATVMAKGSRTAITSLANVKTDLLTKELTIKLERGTEIGGKVLEASQRPITGANIRVRGVVKDPFGKFSLTDLDSVTTDSNGKWTSTGAGPEVKGLIFSVNSTGFLDAEYEQGDDATGPFVLSRADLAAKSSVIKMEPAKPSATGSSR
jgi:hypothetical protein